MLETTHLWFINPVVQVVELDNMPELAYYRVEQ
jgi:hypothetical protein